MLLHDKSYRPLSTKAYPKFVHADEHDEEDPAEEEERRRLSEQIDRLEESFLSAILPNATGQSTMDRETRMSIQESNRRLNEELGNDDECDRDDEDYFVDDTYVDDDHDEIVDSGRQPLNTKDRETLQKSAMEILRRFDSQSAPSCDDPEELQLWLECAAQREAVQRYQELVSKARDRKAFDTLSMMQKLLVRWYEGTKNAVEIRQKEYLSSKDNRRARKRYGPFLCSLPPEKMAVIAAHEAMTQALLHSGKSGREGVPLVKIALAIGMAVETEVISQRRMKERFHDRAPTMDDTEEDEESLDGEELKGEESQLSSEKETEAVEKWKFSASHLKLFMADLQRNDPKFGKNKRSIAYAMQRAKQAMNSHDAWTEVDALHLGTALLSILVENTSIENEKGRQEPVFRIEKKWTPKGKTKSYVVLNEDLHRSFKEDELLSWAASTTRYTPMIVPPTEWTGPKQGGYRWLQADLMRTHGSHVQRDALQHGDLSLVYDGLNILGKTAWKINEKILRIATICWNENIPIGDIPSRVDHTVPPEPIRPPKLPPEVYKNKESPEAKAAAEANQLYREAVYKRQRVIQKNMDLRSLRCSAVLKLNQAEQFKDFEKIYFPYNLDFRGRAYPVPPHLSNVGSDLCRGMLKFSEAKPLGTRGLYWLKVHLANFAGKDKMSFDDRARYVDENMDNVRRSVNEPLSQDPWWMTLDDPFQGLATCHEIVNAIDSGNPESYMCSLPVHMDGSCNGLQHYAALGRDTVGGKAVNLLEGDGPEDVYVGVMHEVIRRVAEEAERELPFDVNNSEKLTKEQKKALKNNQAAKLVNGLIDRGVVKRTVMTSVYGVTYIGARQQIQEKIEEKLEEKGYDLDEIDREVFAAAGYLATVTMEVMGDLFQGARNTKTWLADCARLISQQGHPVAWISPIGIPAVQPYRQRRPRTVVTVMQTITMTDEGDDLPVHTSRQCTAFPPNYVHSLDSSHMLLTALEMDRRGLTYSAVHDSFWTHACDVDEMNEALRDCFVHLYNQPLLAKLKESWELRYPEVEFPELPERGDLDLNEVKSATYFFQ